MHMREHPLNSISKWGSVFIIEVNAQFVLFCHCHVVYSVCVLMRAIHLFSTSYKMFSNLQADTVDGILNYSFRYYLVRFILLWTRADFSTFGLFEEILVCLVGLTFSIFFKLFICAQPSDKQAVHFGFVVFGIHFACWHFNHATISLLLCHCLSLSSGCVVLCNFEFYARNHLNIRTVKVCQL